MSGKKAERPSGGAAPRLPIRRTKARGGAEMVVLGQGTSRMGLDPAYRKQEVAALRLGLDLGMSVIDTAEVMPTGAPSRWWRGPSGDGVTRPSSPPRYCRTTPLGRARSRRSKAVSGGSAPIASISTCCTRNAPLEPSRHRTRWRRRWKPSSSSSTSRKDPALRVNNFDTDAMQAIERFGLGKNIAANQVLYNLTARGIERGLIDWCTERDVMVMVYMPMDKARLPARPALEQVARRHDVTPMCAAIAWTLRHPSVVAIPKARDLDHLRQMRLPRRWSSPRKISPSSIETTRRRPTTCRLPCPIELCAWCHFGVGQTNG